MALTLIQQCRLELADTQPVPFQYLDDQSYQYFLQKNSNSVRKACLDAAKTILFLLSRSTRETLEAMEVYGNQHFEQYKQALLLFIKDPNYSLASFAQPYASGISNTDIINNIQTLDNNIVDVQKAIPQDGEGATVNTDVFNTPRLNAAKNPFSV